VTTVALTVHPDVWLDPEKLDFQIRRVAGKRVERSGSWRVLRKSIDARRGKISLKLQVELLPPGTTIEPITPVDLPALHGEPTVVIVGAGPAGMFCAWELAQRGILSIVLERGKPVRARRRDLATLTRHGELDPDSNYCFGEGGAGTFSDGKLYTRSHKRGELDTVLSAFVGYGAPDTIRVDARPHIGTNKLPGVVTRMREHLESAGVRFLFGARATGLLVRDGAVVGVELDGGDRIEAKAVVVAVGHSARDVQRWLADAGARLEAKPFAVGVRVEHPQAFIDRTQFGKLAGHPALGPASYRLVEQVVGVGVFSFCMCPGGFICPAATEPGGQVVNGWSPSSRSGRYANSGFVTEVGPEQLKAAGYGPDDPFAGVLYQAELERRAYAAGGGDFVGPAQRLTDLVAGRASPELPPCSYPRGVVPADLSEVLGSLIDPIRIALQRVGERMLGFIGDDAIAVGVESRTSCPIRTVRDRETLQSPTLPGLYPCGEGAGFAGGIMSAALDGIRIAGAVAGRNRDAP
jgi:uncharacterized FAD-dependent dehydrogenase